MGSKINLPAFTWFEGFLLSCRSRRLSENTINDYSVTLKKFFIFIGDQDPAAVTKNTVQGFLASQTVSNKTLSNYFTGLNVFYTWALGEGLVTENPLARLRRPKHEVRVIQSIPLDHVRKMLASADRSDIYSRPGKRSCSNELPAGDRNRLIILFLLDTGVRVSELIGLKWADLDLGSLNAKVYGKGNKERLVCISSRTGRALWRYKAAVNGLDQDPVFGNASGQALTRNAINLVLRRMCTRAGVPIYSPHDFRHTFAIQFLRNHPNIFALQALLGHSSLDMVKRYLAISQVDLSEAHLHGSPVENWGL